MNPANKMNKTCRVILKKKRRTYKHRSLVDYYTWTYQVCRPAKLCEDTIFSPEDLPGEMDNREREREGGEGVC